MVRLFVNVPFWGLKPFNPLQVGVFNKPKGSGGGRSAPLGIWPSEIILTSFLDIYLEWVVKVKNPKAQGGSIFFKNVPISII